MNNRSGVKGLVFGGLMAGLTVLLVYFFPLPMFLPVPLVLVYVRHGFRSSIVAGAAAALLTAMLMGPMAGLLRVLPLAVLPALALGYGITQKLSPLVTIAATSVAAFATMLLNIAVGILLIGQNPIDLMMRSWEASMNYSVELSEQFAAQGFFSSEQVEQIKMLAELAPPFMVQLLPMLLLISALMSAFFAYVACRWLLPRFGHPVEPVAPYREWRLPQWVVWVLMAGAGLMFLSSYAGEAADWTYRLGLNILIGTSYLYVIIGLAVAYHFLSNRMSKGLAIGLLILAFFMFGNLGSLVLIFLGMWDALFDFRKLRTQTEGGNQS